MLLLARPAEGLLRAFLKMPMARPRPGLIHTSSHHLNQRCVPIATGQVHGARGHASIPQYWSGPISPVICESPACFPRHEKKECDGHGQWRGQKKQCLPRLITTLVVSRSYSVGGDRDSAWPTDGDTWTWRPKTEQSVARRSEGGRARPTFSYTTERDEGKHEPCQRNATLKGRGEAAILHPSMETMRPQSCFAHFQLGLAYLLLVLLYAFLLREPSFTKNMTVHVNLIHIMFVNDLQWPPPIIVLKVTHRQRNIKLQSSYISCSCLFMFGNGFL